MIKVNLVKSIPVGSSPSAAGLADLGEGVQLGSEDIQKQGAIRLLMMLAFPVLLYVFETQNIPELKSQVRKKQAEIQVLVQKNDAAKGAVEEIVKFKEDKEKLQKQVDTLESLQKDRDREVKILDNIQKDIPEKVWLRRLEFKDTELFISGTAVTDSDIASFIDSLGKIYTILSVSSAKSEDIVSERGTFKSFEIACKIDRPSQRNN